MLTLMCLAPRSAGMKSTGLSVSTRRVVFPGPTKHGPATAPAYCLRCLNQARLAVSGIEDKVDAPASGQARDFGSDIVALVVKHVMRARLSGQRYRFRRAAAADDESCPEDAGGHLHGEMPNAAPTAWNVDCVPGLDVAVEAREG